MTSATHSAQSTASTGSDVLLIDVLVPVRIVSEANSREHWRKSAVRKKAHRSTAMLLCRAAHGWQVPTPGQRYRVLMTRIAPRQLDSDNLASGFKAARDGIADAMGIDDGSPLIDWQVAQEKGEPNVYAARVQIWEVR